MTKLYYNWIVSVGIPAGTEWISTDIEEFAGRDWNGNSIQQLVQRELTVDEMPNFAEKIAECYAGDGGCTNHEDIEELAKWIGEGGQAVSKKLHTLIEGVDYEIIDAKEDQ